MKFRSAKPAREVIAGVHHMRAEMANYASGRHAVLRVHANTSAMTRFLPADVADFSAGHEHVRIVLEECWSEEAVRRVRSGEAHLGVVVEGCDIAGLWSRPYRHDRLAAVLREDDAPEGTRSRSPTCSSATSSAWRAAARSRACSPPRPHS